MHAWVVSEPGPIAGGPLEYVEMPDPQPGLGEVRVAVSACGVCRTDLHLAAGDRYKGAAVLARDRGDREGRRLQS